MIKEKKDFTIKIRLTEREYECLKYLSNLIGFSVSDIVRQGVQGRLGDIYNKALSDNAFYQFVKESNSTLFED